MDLNAWPKSRNGKKIHCHNTFKLSIMQKNKWEVGWTFEATLLTPSNIPLPRYGRIYFPFLGPQKNHKQYEIMINDYLLVITWIFLPWWLCLEASGGHGCPISTCITFCNRPCILGSKNHSSTIHLGARMRFIDYYIVLKSWK